ncbi:hypothetical protein LguiB_017826 [Lonicera macranthoides]
MKEVSELSSYCQLKFCISSNDLILMDLSVFFLETIFLHRHLLCGACGYDLNLSSSSRNTSTIGSKYRKSMKKGIISFLYVDESRFTQVEEFRCLPFFFIFKRSWGLFRRRTKLLCRKCGNRIGVAYDDNSKSHLLVSDGPHLASSNGIPTYRKYDIRIRALQPTSSVELGTPHLS